MFLVNVTPLIRLPKNIEQLFTYEVPRELYEVCKKGSIVLIQFRNKRVLGLVDGREKQKNSISLKPIIKVLPVKPITGTQFWLINELQNYYGISKTLAAKTVIGNIPISSKTETATTKEYVSSSIILADYQKKVLQHIKKSGKTIFLIGQLFDPADKVFITLAKDIIEKRKKVLCLFGDTQSLMMSEKRYSKVFQKRLAIIHSGLSVTGVGKIWQQINNNEIDIVLGTRSSIFCPLDNLGIILLFDSLSDGHKSWDNSPYYDVRYLAQKLAKQKHITFISTGIGPQISLTHKSKILRWQNKKNAKLSIFDRRALPLKDRAVVLRPELRESINKINSGYVLIYINRLGYANLTCQDCEFIPRCHKCDHPFIYSSANAEKIANLTCFHCHNVEKSIVACPECHGHNLKFFGVGIEKVEEEIKKSFPERKITIIDTLKIKSPTELNNILSQIGNNDGEIVIATSIIMPRLWFIKKPSLVIALKAESLVLTQDWRTNENAYFTLLSLWLVATNAFMVDTALADHDVFSALSLGSMHKFLSKEKGNRQRFGYPPYGNIIKITYPFGFKSFNLQLLQKQFKNVKIIPMDNLDPKPRFIIKTPINFPIEEVWKFIPAEAKIDVNPLSLI